MKKILRLYSRYKLVISIILLGVIIRLIVAVLSNHFFDFFNILAVAKSVADTGNITDGYFRVGHIQLYGKIYYQVIAVGFLILEKIHLLDLKYIFDLGPYQGFNYMNQFPYLGPEVYQLVAIKFTQFIYDLMLLFFIIKIGVLLNFKNLKVLALAWALNPIFIINGYILFQSDLAMTAFLVGGAYFTIKAIKKKNQKFNLANKLAAILFFTIGAVIKQVPLLVIPFVVLMLGSNIIQVISLMLFFAISYFVFYQSWSADGILIKSFFLTSNESMALFRFSINGLNVFFSLYLGALIYFFSIKNKIKNQSILILQLIVLILCVVYIATDINFLFANFSVWIMPFLALLALYNRNYSLFLFVPVISFYKQVMTDNTFLIGGQAILFGEPLSKIPQYYEFVDRFINSELVIKLIGNVTTVGYIILGIYIIYELTKNQPLPFIKNLNNLLNLNLTKATLGIVIIFALTSFIEYAFMTQESQLTNYIYPNSKEKILSRKPVVIDIDNPNNFSIKGIILKIKLKGISGSDYTNFKVVDRNTNKTLTLTKVQDYFFEKNKEYFNINFSKTIKRDKIRVEIFKEKGINETVVFESFDSTNKLSELSARHDNFYKNNYIKMNLSKSKIDINLRGRYPLEYAIDNFYYNVNKKPTFFQIYFGFTIVLIFIFIFISRTLFVQFYKKTRNFLNKNNIKKFYKIKKN